VQLGDTIVQVASASGGGVGLVRVSGPQAHAIGRALVARATPPRERELVYARAKSASGETLDAGLYVEFAAKRSFTGEASCEFQGHGSFFGMAQIVARCVELGARPGEAGEFTWRAFRNGKLDLAQAEAVAEAVAAKTDSAHRAAQRQLHGELSERVTAIRAPLIAAASAVAADIDFPDEDLAPLDSREVHAQLAAAGMALDALIAEYRRGRRVREGAEIAIVGPPNAGKSSVLNALVGYDRAIVSPLAGTTRDTVEATMVLGGVSVRIVDTAGLRASGDVIELQGMSRAREAASHADVVLLVVSDDAAWADMAQEWTGDRVLAVCNKTDRGEVAPALADWCAARDAMRVSARTGAGVAELREALSRRVGCGDEAPLVTVERHATLLSEALTAVRAATAALAVGPELAAVEIGAAVRRLGDVLGEDLSAEAVAQIFKRFCIGK
jgi:tRNA modification GTPase